MRQVQQGTAAEIFHHVKVSAVGQFNKIFQLRAFGKTDDFVVTAVISENHAGVFVDGLLVICNARFVGGANFLQDGAGNSDDIRHAKPTADFDELAA